MSGTVVSIHIVREAGAAPVEAAEVQAVPGRGLVGDRYFERKGTFSVTDKPGRSLTLIEREAVEAVAGEHGIRLEPGELRRNIVTAGVSLNDLVGREFTIGEVRVLGIRLCEPCEHLARLTHERVREVFARRAGLRCDILTEGAIRAGDTITV